MDDSQIQRILRSMEARLLTDVCALRAVADRHYTSVDEAAQLRRAQDRLELAADEVRRCYEMLAD